MASKLLTDSLIKSLKGKSKQYAQNDGDGLSLLVLPNGSMSWRYRYRFAGKAKMLSLRGYPEVSLKQAREDIKELPALLRDIDKYGDEVAGTEITRIGLQLLA